MFKLFKKNQSNLTATEKIINSIQYKTDQYSFGLETAKRLAKHVEWAKETSTPEDFSLLLDLIYNDEKRYSKVKIPRNLGYSTGLRKFVFSIFDTEKNYNPCSEYIVQETLAQKAKEKTEALPFSNLEEDKFISLTEKYSRYL